jgi:hypothetical protein
MRPESITLAIEEKYTPEEKSEIAEKLAVAVAELEVITMEKKVSDAAFNERIKRCDGQITTLAKSYNKGCETAQVGCDIRYDHPELGKKSYFRLDRNELVETHDMSWEEKQETIQFPLTQPTDEQVSDALNSLTILPADEEVTKLCPFPNCTLFAEHDGEHAIAPTEMQPPPEEQDEAGAA